MRSIVTFGIIAIFVGMAFTKPSDAAVAAFQTHARTQISSTAARALFSGAPNATEDMQKAARLMGAMASDPRGASYMSALSSSLGVNRPGDVLQRTAKVLADAAPTPRAVVARAIAVVRPAVPRSQEWKHILAKEEDAFLKEAYETIDWAQRKTDVQYCREFDSSVAVGSSVGPTIGDLLALCLAKVSGDTARCEQIDVQTAPALKKVCETELVTFAVP